MSEINTVCIGTQEYRRLIEAQIENEQLSASITGMTDYLDRVEKCIFDLIRKDTKYGEYDWKLNGEYRDIISVLNAHEVDWTEGKPDDIDGGYAE